MWSPLGESVLNQTGRWQPEPLARGTFGILSTSLITLSLCLWTALHLNVPGEGLAKHHKWHRVLWLVLGLLAPEVVALCAYKQWALQRELSRKIREVLGDRLPVHPKHLKPSIWSRILGALKLRNSSKDYEQILLESQHGADASHPNRRVHPWTAAHGFFAMMGGFVFDTSRNPDICPLPGGRKQLTLMPKALIFLAEFEPDLLPDISTETIRDKSKANSFAKLLVCVQASWFCLQIITRMVAGLAVTLLELNVFAHSLCALVIYLLWWNKPLDIEEPYHIYVSDPELASICAAMCVGSRLHYSVPCVTYRNGVKVRFRRGPFFEVGREVLSWKDPSAPPVLEVPATHAPDESERQSEPPSQPVPTDLRPLDRFQDLQVDEQTVWTELPISSGLSWLLMVPVAASYTIYDLFHPSDPELSAVVDLNEDFFTRHRLSQETPLGKSILREAIWTGKYANTSSNRDYVAGRMPNWPLHHSSQCSEGGLMESLARYTGLFTVVGCLYGACHLLAWNAPFRTKSESLLWKISAIGVGVVPACLWAGVRGSVPISRNTGSQWVQLFSLCSMLFTIIVFALFLPFSRIFLVVECFLSLPYVPDSAFAVPSWSPYFFHAS